MSLNLLQNANKVARQDIQIRRANAVRNRNLDTTFKTGRVWGGKKPPIDQIFEKHGVYPDEYRFVVFTGPRGQGKGIGGGVWIDGVPAKTEGEARQMARDTPIDDPVMVLDLDTGRVLYENYLSPNTDAYADPNKDYFADDPWLNAAS